MITECRPQISLEQIPQEQINCVASPDYAALDFTGIDIPSRTIQEQVQEPMLEIVADQFRSANFWQWDNNDWQVFLAYNSSQRNKQGSEYQEHPCEKALIEFGRWYVQEDEPPSDLLKYGYLAMLASVHVDTDRLEQLKLAASK